MDANNQEINELGILENQLQNFLANKQVLQIELNEINNALEELSKYDGEIYKILSGLMMRTSKEKVKNDLSSRKKILTLQVDSFEKQQKIVEKKLEEHKKRLFK